MFRSRYIACGLVLGLAALVGCVRTPPTAPADEAYDPELKIDVPEEDLKELARGNNEFAIELFKKVAETEKGNIVLSPYSIRTALAMVYAGARGETKEEMKKVLRFTLPDDRLHAAMGGVTESMQTTGKNRPYELSIANALWVQKGMSLKPDFLDINRRFHAAGVRELDFGNSEGSRLEINHWVDEKTKHKVSELLPPQALHGSTGLVITNAMYFQGAWKKSFEAGMTSPQDFTTDTGQKIQAPMMVGMKIQIGRYKGSGFQVVDIPYAGTRWGMTVLLPDEGNYLAGCINGLNAASLDQALKGLTQATTGVWLPKFHTEKAEDFKVVLKRMGINHAFDGVRADFSGIAERHRPSISAVVNQTKIETDEKGTVAAAATAVVMQNISAEMPIYINRAFVYFIRDDVTGSVLFMGKITDPR